MTSFKILFLVGGLVMTASLVSAQDEGKFQRYGGDGGYVDQRFPDRIPPKNAWSYESNPTEGVVKERADRLLKFVESGIVKWNGSFQESGAVIPFKIEAKRQKDGTFKGMMVQLDAKSERGYIMAYVTMQINPDKVVGDTLVSAIVNLTVLYLDSGRQDDYTGSLDGKRWSLQDRYQRGNVFGTWNLTRVD